MLLSTAVLADINVGSLSTATPNSLAMMAVAVDSEIPLIFFAGSAMVIEPMDGKAH